VLKYVRQRLLELKEEIDYSLFVAQYLNILLSKMYRCSRLKISKDLVELNTTINQ
jgi:hypothetical protein